jgi:hypothetical protein
MKVFRLFRRNGDLAQVALSEAQLVELCPESRRLGWRIVASDENVPEATGTVRDWSGGAGCGGRKVHWQCPLCDQEHWSDLKPHAAVANPVLWLCEGGGGTVCLVHWQHEQVA